MSSFSRRAAVVQAVDAGGREGLGGAAAKANDAPAGRAGSAAPARARPGAPMAVCAGPAALARAIEPFAPPAGP